MSPTIRDVARMAETSVSTVSRVLTGTGPVRNETRRRIVEAISQLGYQPNALARGLVQGRSSTVGVVIPDVANPFYGEVLRGMSDVATHHGFQLLLANADLSFIKEREAFALLREKQVDGIIYASGTISDDHREIFAQLGRPVVLAATVESASSLSAVLVDSKMGARMGLEHLLGLGHRRIALIGGPRTDLIAGLPRWEGWQEAAERARLELRPEWLVEGNYRLESGYRAMELILAMGAPPTAVATSSDMMAVGAINAILDRGLRVPEDISVIGFDNIWMAGAVRPALTTVAQPMYDIGAKSMALLVQAIAGQSRITVQWIQPSVIVRKSTAPPSQP